VSDRPVVLVHGLYGTLDDPALVAELRAAATVSHDLLGNGLPDAMTGVRASADRSGAEAQAPHTVRAPVAWGLTRKARSGRPATLVGHKNTA
jgi:hypothetical protein